MGSRKTSLIKKRLSKAFRSNVPLPNWKRSLPGMKNAYNTKRRHWRSNTLKVY
ncbi:large subunit ribosomal protein L39e [Enteropsectra breve]|nr:large subunit ribosomal protein L39e [Enteropsectra breve]